MSSQRHLLISVDDLADRLTQVSLIDARSVHEFTAGHLPGAQSLDLFYLSLNDTRPDAFNAFMWTISSLFNKRGVDPSKEIVFYDEISGMRAARGFWFCEYLGYTVRVLDGGVTAWCNAGYDLTTEVAEPPRVDRSDTYPQIETHWSADQIAQHLTSDEVAILDTRSADEHYGRIARAQRAGSIPNAVHLEWTENLQPDGRFKSIADLEEMYQAVGITSDKQVVCYCQGGYRSAHSYLALRLIGYPKVSNYIGSWQEWGNRTDLPIEIPIEIGK
ncbi:sulfurtransferase [Candidatus Poribacteria bacterium]|nr:sulfurtransferase [Candidatus Poribacteria bacterium]